MPECNVRIDARRGLRGDKLLRVQCAPYLPHNMTLPAVSVATPIKPPNNRRRSS
eukprot:gene9671-3066_t